MKLGLALMSLLVAASAIDARVHLGTTEDEGELWVVLVAGSNNWFNYRHQSDVCHAYQILHANGVPDDHIIVMMYDDIANNRDNPTPGKIINRPDGPNVYQGVPKDYTGDQVTPEVFFKVLSGDAEGLNGLGSGKVVKSGANDRVFVNLVDHGAPGIFGFPRAFMKARNFTDVVLQMHKERKFKEMYVYMEACESGSMFQNLFPDDIGFYALSAANASESSYACYMDKKLHTFLGDVFSIKWMEDSDKEDVTQETLKKQFDTVKAETTTSHVLQWGEIKLEGNKVSTILGSKGQEEAATNNGPFPPFHDACMNSSVSSPDVPVAILQSHLDSAETDAEKDHWHQQIASLHEHRDLVRDTMKKLAVEVTSDGEMAEQVTSGKQHTISKWDCYETSTDAFHQQCFNLGENPFALRVVQTLVNLCEHGYSSSKIVSATQKVCTHPHVTGIH